MGALASQVLEEHRVTRILLDSIEAGEARMMVLLSRLIVRPDVRIRVKRYYESISPELLTVLAPAMLPNPHLGPLNAD